jgi:3-oxoacyl-[acyl-carrier-protein] synthase-1
MQAYSYIILTPQRLVLNGVDIPCETTGSELVTSLYRNKIDDYPKFFKMDTLSKVGFVAGELLLHNAKQQGWRPLSDDDTAILFFNRSSSRAADSRYQETIQQRDSFYPSPAIFVYTLPNIVTGEIAIRNHFYGETNFIVLPSADAKTMSEQMCGAFQDKKTETLLSGWLDCLDDNHYEARLIMLRRQDLVSLSSLQQELENIINI